ncbi:hypothetical protein OS580_001463 [Escherichia coli]|nr:hypothetical protein [Escherichia coli]
MYQEHTLSFDFINNKGAFDQAGNNRITVKNARATVSLSSVVANANAVAEITLYGLGRERLADLSYRACGLNSPENEISVEVYADNSVVFSGVLTSSVANMNDQPDSSLMIAAYAGGDLQNKAQKPFSAQGGQPLTDVLAVICQAAGYRAECSDMDGLMTSGSPHYDGSAYDQIFTVCRDYGIAYCINPGRNIRFWPRNNKKDDVVPLVSSDNGLIGWPIFSNGGVMFQTKYSPLLVTGRYVQLETNLPHASGQYQLSTVRHELSSWTPNGPWHSVCTANRNTEKQAQDSNSAPGPEV